MASGEPRTRLVNTFGTLSYIAIILQWLWSLLILFYPLIISGQMTQYLQPQPAVSIPAHTFTFGSFTPIATIIAIAVTIVVLIISTVAIAKLPAQIGRRGAQLSRSASTIILPTLTQHKTVSKRRAIRLSYRIILMIRILCIVIPLIALLWMQPLVAIDSSIIWVIAVWCAGWSLLWLAAQTVTAVIMKLPRELVW